MVLLLVGAGVGIAIGHGSGGGTSGTSIDESSTPAVAPTTAMFDPSASAAQTIASIRSDYCAAKSNAFPEASVGRTLIECAGPNGGGFNSSVFYVYSSAQAFQLALTSGNVMCMSGATTVLGPSWVANLFNADDAATLVSEGASASTCN